MQAHPTVSREEWLKARRDLLAKEKAHLKAQDALARETPRAALGQGRQDLRVRRTERQGDALRPVRRPQPAHRQALHAGPGLAGRLRRLLVRRRPARRLGGPPDQPRRHAGGGLTRALSRRSPPSTSAWAGTSSGCRRTARDFNFDFNVSFTEADKARGKVFYNFEDQPYMSDELPGIQRLLPRTSAGQIFHTYSVFARGTEEVGTRLRFPRHHAQGPQRAARHQPDGLGPPP